MVVTEVLALSTRCFKDTVPFRYGTLAKAARSEEKAGKAQVGNPTFTQKNVGLKNRKRLFYQNIPVLWGGALCSNRAGDPSFLVRSGQMGLWFLVSGSTGWLILGKSKQHLAPVGWDKALVLETTSSMWETLQGSQGKEAGGGDRQPQIVQGFLDTMTCFSDGCACCSVFHLNKLNKINS